jgi:hypothetical protein
MKFGSSKMAVAISSPSLGHLKTQRKTAREAEREYGPKPGRKEK